MAAVETELRIAVIGCGDIALRRYLPALRQAAADVHSVVCCDLDAGKAARAAATCRTWASSVGVAAGIEEAVRAGPIDAAFNLTPPKRHAEVTAACLAAGCHVFSEKPFALDVETGRALLAAAAEAGRMLLCAPATMATSRLRWLQRVIASGRLGRVTLASAQLANLGPAAWRDYGGDPRSYYEAGVGPALDQGIYLLHALTGLLGDVQRVQSMQSTAIPERIASSRGERGCRMRVTSPDVVLLQLDFGNGTLAHVLSSFAVPASRAPLLELHAERGSIVLDERPPLTDHGPVDVYLRDPELEADGWLERLHPPRVRDADNSLIGAGALHFLDCLRGRDTPRLGGRHALHVLDVLRTAEAAAAAGRALPVATAGDA